MCGGCAGECKVGKGADTFSQHCVCCTYMYIIFFQNWSYLRLRSPFRTNFNIDYFRLCIIIDQLPVNLIYFSITQFNFVLTYF